MNKNLIYIVVVIVIIAAGVWFWMSNPSTEEAPNDTTASINKDLNNISVQDPDFKGIDADLNAL